MSDLKKEDYGTGTATHGWISPEGEYHHLGPKEMHAGYAGNTRFSTLEDGYRAGWISLGHAGERNVAGSTETLSNKSSPAMRTARKMMNEHHAGKEMELGELPEGSEQHKLHQMNVDEFSRHGLSPRLKKMDEALERFELTYIELRKSDLDEAADRLGEFLLEKGKNSKQRKREVFGRWKTKKGSPERAKQMAALNEYGKKRYGMKMERAPGKVNASGKIIDKPTLDNKKGTIQHIGNPDSATHEFAHLEVSPPGVPVKQHQKDMDKEWGRQNKVHGYKQQARTKEEYETTALENKVRRQVGLPAHEKHTTEAKGKRDMAADVPGKKITHEVPGKGGKPGKRLTGTSHNISPEAHKRFDQQSRGEQKYDRKTGWVPGTSTNAKINTRAREKAADPSRKDAKTLLRNSEDDSFVAMSEEKPKGLKILEMAKSSVMEKIAQVGHGSMGAPAAMTGAGALVRESIVGSTYDKEKAKDSRKELMDQIPPRVRPLFEKAIVNEELMKPYESEAQRRWAHTEAGKQALGGEAKVHEWDESTKGKELPERVGKSLATLRGMVAKSAGEKNEHGNVIGTKGPTGIHAKGSMHRDALLTPRPGGGVMVIVPSHLVEPNKPDELRFDTQEQAHAHLDKLKPHRIKGPF